MDLLAQLFAGQPGPIDDFWYQPVPGAMTLAGMKVDAEGAKKISAWFRGRDILATSLAMLPLKVYALLPDDAGAEVAASHPLHDVLSRKPNAADDAFTWKRRAMFDIVDAGHAYNWLGVGRTWTLDRIDPAYVRFEKIKNGPHKGRLLYYVRDETSGQTTTHTQDEIFHLRGADGKGILESARDNLGLAMTTEQYAARIFSKGTLNGGVIEVPGPMDEDSARAMAKSFVTASGDWHMPKVLPMGAKMADPKLALTPENAQMLLSRKFAISDIARWLGLPPHMIGDLERATFSNIEQQGQEFVTYSLGPWLSLWEFAINDQLILQPNRFYAEFTRDALVRGDIAARWAAYMSGVQSGVLTRNEVRRKENLNALEGLDEPLTPANITGNQAAAATPPEPAPPEPATPSKAQAIAQASAARLLRKEVTAVQKLAVRHAANQDAFAAAVTEFYDRHAELVAVTLMLSMNAAREYCAAQAAQALGASWMRALELWQSEHYASGLAAIALEGEAA